MDLVKRILKECSKIDDKTLSMISNTFFKGIKCIEENNLKEAKNVFDDVMIKKINSLKFNHIYI